MILTTVIELNNDQSLQESIDSSEVEILLEISDSSFEVNRLICDCG